MQCILTIERTKLMSITLQAIHGYRETERKQWSKKNKAILQRVRNLAFPPGVAQMAFVHVLDITKDGYIKAHIDSVRVSCISISGVQVFTLLKFTLPYTQIHMYKVILTQSQLWKGQKLCKNRWTPCFTTKLWSYDLNSFPLCSLHIHSSTLASNITTLGYCDYEFGLNRSPSLFTGSRELVKPYPTRWHSKVGKSAGTALPSSMKWVNQILAKLTHHNYVTVHVPTIHRNRWG